MSRSDSRFKKMLASILATIILLNLFPLSLLALDAPYYSVSDEYEFSVTRVISSRWEDHANIDFTITNNGNTTINNWYITTDLPYEVENIWNASIAETSDSYITISSAPQNQPIEPGCSVTFGITGYSEDDSLFDVESSFYLLNIEDVVIPVEKYQTTTNVYSTTETGFSGAIAITNISSELLTIENVVLNSTNGLTINGNAAIEDETSLVVDSSSRNIYPSASIYINFEGTNEIPEVLDLRYTGLAFTLTEDEDNDGILDIDEFLYPEEEPEVTPTPTSTPEVEEPTETPTVTPEEEPTPTPEITEEYLYQDDDSDGLINGFELYLGYDVNSSDTDGDGILDIDEDFDLDGLKNGEEINLELNPATNDTDLDLLLDYDEIYVYGTNPSLYDTDRDGVSDYDEIYLGKNPLVNDIDVLISQEKSLELISDELNGVNLATVSIDLADNISHQLQIRNVYNVDMYSSAIESLVGCPIDITCDEEFTEATITFTYVPELLDCSPEDLGILWYDEESGFYVVQDSVLDTTNNTISTTVNHFSKYMVINAREWRERWDYILNGYSYDVMPEEDEFEGIDYSIHIQIGPTVSGAQRQQMYDAFLELTTIMGPNDTLTVGIMSERGCFWSRVGLNIETATALMEEYIFPSEESSNYINLMDHHNYHAVRTTFPSVMSGFGSYTGDNREHVNILMLDPDILYRNSEPGYELQAIPRAYGNDTNQSLYFIVPDKASMDNEYLQICAPYSNGGILRASNNIVDDFLELRELNRATDEDGDGLYDIHEERGLVLSNGQIIYTDPTLYDTDSDGYSDSEELELSIINRVYENVSTNPRLLTYADGSLVPSHPMDTYILSTGCWRIYRMSSNPTKADSDGDGVFDFMDATPLKVNGAISYIVSTYENDTDITDAIEPYERELDNLGYEYETVYATDIYTFLDFWHGMNRLSHNPSNRIAYSYVQELVIMGHGRSEGILFEETVDGFNSIFSGIVRNNLAETNNQSCRIVNLDLQTCNSANEDENGNCIAYSFIDYVSAIENVYAWDGNSTFVPIINATASIFTPIPNPLPIGEAEVNLGVGSYVCIHRGEDGSRIVEELGAVTGILERAT